MHTHIASLFSYFSKPEGAESSNVQALDVEGQQNGTEGSSSSSSAYSSSTDQWDRSPECRICLSAGDAGDLVQPCSCSGTLNYTHTACLSAWVQVRGSLVCELCRQRYKAPHAQQLETIAAAATASKRVGAQGTATASDLPVGLSKWSVAIVLLSVLVAVIVFVVVLVMMSRRKARQGLGRAQGDCATC